jgi:hypothetical protein
VTRANRGSAPWAVRRGEPGPSTAASAPERAGSSQGVFEYALLRKPDVDGHVRGEILDLLLDTFGEWPGAGWEVDPAAHLAWKLASPDGDLACAVGRLDGRIETVINILSRRLRLGDQERVAVDFVDVAVRPEHQSKGLFSAVRRPRDAELASEPIVQLSNTRHPVVLGTRASRGTRLLGPKIGALFLPLPGLRPGAGLPRVGSLPPVLVGAALRLASRVSALRYRKSATARDYRIDTLERFDERAERLFQSAAAGFDVLMVRSPAYLEWRYRDPRAGDFVVRGATRSDELVAYAISRRIGPLGYLVDLLCRPDHLAALRPLVADAVCGLEASGAGAVVCWLPVGHPYYRSLRAAGFVETSRSTNTGFRPYALPPREIEKLASPQTRLHYMLGDTDLV